MAGVAAVVLLVACAHPPADRGQGLELAVETTGPCGTGVALDLDCAALPNTSAHGVWVDASGNTLDPQPSSGQTTSSAYLDYDLWAWNSFIALNWPAVLPSSTNGYQRGFPDLSKSFAKATPDDLTVWETYKEKRELFLYDHVTNKVSSQTPLPWNNAPVYGPTDAQVPDCPTTGAQATPSFERHLGQASKTDPTFFDSLDETAEVASEARETQAVLCAGWVDPTTQCSLPGANTCCTLNGQAVGPRVWMGDPHAGGALPVLYEVKVNYDFFQYVTDSKRQYYSVSKARAAATAGDITLPARTSDSDMPPMPGTKSSGSYGPNPGPTSYSANSWLQTTTGTPALQGSVHLKAAWIDISGMSADEQAKYHQGQAYHYVSNSSVPGGICKQSSLYGLVGLHIIQRVHQDVEATSGGSQARGGTFVFATWEQKDNDTAGFTYANYSGAPPTASPTALEPFPNVAQTNALPLDRAYEVLDSTRRANDLVYQQLGCSGSSPPVWCNYELVGVQYRATSTPSPLPTQIIALPSTPMANIEAPANSGQPYYLANLVVESNVGLQQFQGLPPSTDPDVITVIDHYKNDSPGNVTSTFSSSSFQRDADNLAFRTRKGGENSTYEYNMGGCMGCHGVAQLSGYAFSFVLLDNQYGGAPDTQTEFTIPPTPDPPR